MVAKLTAAERQQALAALPEWRVVEGRDAITRTFRFADFSAAFGFMARAALAAEKMDHHPEWSNLYRTVTVILATHEAGGLTARDIDLARTMDRLAAAAG